MTELKAVRSGAIYNIIEYEDCFRTDDLYYPKTEVDAALNELRKKYELAIATIKEYKNDIANLNEKLYEAEHDT
jgi:cell division septum initiation protein DivIVA